ncbi:RNA methyltransferase [bacterium]|nr:RNA methyltransferase [bacterium]
MNPLFPFEESFTIEDKKYSYQEVINVLKKTLSSERVARIQSVCAQRFLHTSVVTEDIHDIGNVNAVMRSVENLGFLTMKNIQAESMKYSARITQGAHKWLHCQNFKTTTECMESLKSSNIQIVCTRLSSRARPIDEIDFSIPTALVFGNEKKGVSDEMREFSDVDCIIPSHGFSQSFNISVAAAISLYHIRYKYRELPALELQKQKILQAHYMLASCKSPHRYF